MATEIAHVSLANEGTRLRITTEDGHVIRATVTEVHEKQVRARFPDGSEGILRDETFEGDLIEALHPGES